MTEHVDADLGDLASLFPEKPVEFRAKSPYRRSSVDAFGYAESDLLDAQSRLRLTHKQMPTEVTPDGAAVEDADLDKEVREKPQPRERALSPHGRNGPIAIEYDEHGEPTPHENQPPPARRPLPPPLPPTTSSFAAALRALSPSGHDHREHQPRAKPVAAGPKPRNAQVVPDASTVDDSFIGGYRDKLHAADRHDRRSVTASRATRVSFAEEDAASAASNATATANGTADDDAQSHASSNGPAALQRWKEEAERLRRENEKLKQDVLLSAKAAPPPPAPSSSSSAGPTKQRRRATSPHGAQRAPAEEEAGEGPLRPQKGPLMPARAVAHTHVPHTHTMQPLQRHHPPNPGQGLGPHAQLIQQMQQMQFTAPDGSTAVCLPKLLWEGGFLWKIPFNGRGAPERRLVAVKRASHASIYSRAVRVVPAGTSQDVLNVGGGAGLAGPITGYMCYPPTLLWYDCDKVRSTRPATVCVMNDP